MSQNDSDSAHKTEPSAPRGESMRDMPMAVPKRVWTADGTEDWSLLTDFGAAAAAVDSMNSMMVTGNVMAGMQMGKMNLAATEIPAPTPGQARTSHLEVDEGVMSAPGQSPVTAPPAGTANTGPQSQVASSAAPTPIGTSSTVISAAIAPTNVRSGSPAMLTVTLADPGGNPVDSASVSAQAQMVAMDMGIIHPTLKPRGGGQYAGQIAFPMAGSWRVTVSVAVPGASPRVKVFVFAVH